MNICQHGQADWRCTTCCLHDLRDRMSQLDQAVTAHRSNTAHGEFVRGGAPSWEPINLAALALNQDIRKAGGLAFVAQQIGRGTHPEMERTVRQWRSRARLILGEALAPYPLIWDAALTVCRNRWAWHNPTVRCPVTSDIGPCAGKLLVHYDDQPYSPTYGQRHAVRCSRVDDHAWSGGLEWMRLGLLFGGVMP